MNHQLLDTAITGAGILALWGLAIGLPSSVRRVLDHRQRMVRLRDHAACDEAAAKHAGDLAAEKARYFERLTVCADCPSCRRALAAKVKAREDAEAEARAERAAHTRHLEAL